MARNPRRGQVPLESIVPMMMMMMMMMMLTMMMTTTVTVMILMCHSRGGWTGRFMQPWIQNCGCKIFRRYSCTWKGNSEIILDAGCVDVKWVWLVRFAVLWLALLMTVMTRWSQ